MRIRAGKVEEQVFRLLVEYKGSSKNRLGKNESKNYLQVCNTRHVSGGGGGCSRYDRAYPGGIYFCHGDKLNP
jgi:hypothetical protein